MPPLRPSSVALRERPAWIAIEQLSFVTVQELYFLGVHCLALPETYSRSVTYCFSFRRTVARPRASRLNEARLAALDRSLDAKSPLLRGATTYYPTAHSAGE